MLQKGCPKPCAGACAPQGWEVENIQRIEKLILKRDEQQDREHRSPDAVLTSMGRGWTKLSRAFFTGSDDCVKITNSLLSMCYFRTQLTNVPQAVLPWLPGHRVRRTFVPGDLQMFRLGHLVPSEGVGPSMWAGPPEFPISFQEAPVFLESSSAFPE